MADDPFKKLSENLKDSDSNVAKAIVDKYEKLNKQIEKEFIDKLNAAESKGNVGDKLKDFSDGINDMLSDNIDDQVNNIKNELLKSAGGQKLKALNNKMYNSFEKQLNDLSAGQINAYTTQLTDIKKEIDALQKDPGKTNVQKEKELGDLNTKLRKVHSEFKSNTYNTLNTSLERFSKMSVSATKLINEKSSLIDPNKTDELTMTLSLLSDEFKKTAKTNLVQAYGGIVAGASLHLKSILGLGKDDSIFSSKAVLGLVSGGLTPLLSTFKNLPTLINSFVTQLDAFTTAIVGVTQALIAAPMELIRFSADMGNKLRNTNIKINNMLEELQTSYDITSNVGVLFQNMHGTLKERRRQFMIDASSDDPEKGQLAKLFGATGDDLYEKIMKESDTIIQAMGVHGARMSKIVIENATSSDAKISNYFFKAKKLMNLAEDDIEYFTNVAIATGQSFPAVFTDLVTATKNAANKFGIDFKMMSKDVLSLRKDITNFAHKSSEDLANVVGKLTQLGVSTQSAMAVFKKFQTFEDAATTAAQLSQSFGMMIDSMSLLKAQDPSEIIEMYKQAFEATGKSFNEMDRFSRDLLIQQTGLDEKAAQALFSAENAGKSYEEVMDDIKDQDPTERQIQVMEDMRGAIVELQQSLSNTFTSVFDAIEKGIGENLAANPDSSLNKAFRGMSTALEGVYQTFLNMDLSALEPVFSRIAGFIDEISKYLSSPGFINGITTMANSIMNMADALLKGDSDAFSKRFKEFIKPAQEIFFTFLGFGKEIFTQVLGIFIEGLPMILDVVNTTLQSILDFIDGKAGGSTSLIEKLATFLGFDQGAANGKFQNFMRNIEISIEKIFGTSGTGPGSKDSGIVGKLGKILKKLTKFLQDDLTAAFNDFLANPEIKKRIAAFGVSIAGNVASGVANSLKFWKDDDEPTSEIKDGVVTQNGSVVKIDNKDNILAMKEGGPISKLLNNSMGGQLTARDVYEASRQGMIDALTAVKTDRPIVIEMNGKILGEVLVENGITAAMAKPNLTRQYPTLNSDALQYPDSQVPLNRFRT